jgi:hypothetical protein
MMSSASHRQPTSVRQEQYQKPIEPEEKVESSVPPVPAMIPNELVRRERGSLDEGTYETWWQTLIAEADSGKERERGSIHAWPTLPRETLLNSRRVHSFKLFPTVIQLAYCKTREIRKTQIYNRWFSKGCRTENIRGKLLNPVTFHMLYRRPIVNRR